MKRQERIIQHPSQLLGLKVWRGVGPQGAGRLRLQAKEISYAQAGSWEKRLNRLYFACGCDKAAIGLMVGTLGYVVTLALQPGGLASLGWNGLWIGLGVVIGATAIGKVVGLWLAQRALDRMVQTLQKEWKARPLPEPDLSTCG